jgi:hypothetical protein
MEQSDDEHSSCSSACSVPLQTPRSSQAPQPTPVAGESLSLSSRDFSFSRENAQSQRDKRANEREAFLFKHFVEVQDECGKAIAVDCIMCAKEKKVKRLLLNKGNSYQSLAKHLVRVHGDAVKDGFAVLQPRLTKKLKREQEDVGGTKPKPAGPPNGRDHYAFVSLIVDYSLPRSVLTHPFTKQCVPGLSPDLYFGIIQDFDCKTPSQLCVASQETCLYLL